MYTGEGKSTLWKTFKLNFHYCSSFIVESSRVSGGSGSGSSSDSSSIGSSCSGVVLLVVIVVVVVILVSNDKSCKSP